MRLIDECKKLRELEQQATGGKWYYEAAGDGEEVPEDLDIVTDEFTICTFLSYKYYPKDIPNAKLITKIRNLAPAMIEVLGCFKEGDEDLLVEYIYQFTEEYGVDGVVFSDTAFGKFMKRMQKAASLMEQEES